jgi:hypothetical protein
LPERESRRLQLDGRRSHWLCLDQRFSAGKSQLFKLDLLTVACTATAFDSLDLQTFGMGLSSNQPGSSDETLFIDSQLHGTDGNKFGSIDRLSDPGLLQPPPDANSI